MVEQRTVNDGVGKKSGNHGQTYAPNEHSNHACPHARKQTSDDIARCMCCEQTTNETEQGTRQSWCCSQGERQSLPIRIAKIIDSEIEQKYDTCCQSEHRSIP